MSDRGRKFWRPVGLFAIAVVLAAAMFLSAQRATSAVSGATALSSSCPASLVAGGHDYHGLPLTMCNFSGLDLSKANFKGATLTGVVFLRSKLTGADFSNATIADSGNAAFPTDFSFADLSNAKFVNTQFNGPTYLTYAALTCTDFSQTKLNNGNAIFGDDPLTVAANANCRTTFNGATMNCEFVPQWRQFDLTNANISACTSQLQTAANQPGYDFSGGKYAGVTFDNLNLAGSNWTGAVLTGASFQGATLDNATGLQGMPGTTSSLSATKFNNASLQNVNLSNASLYGADFTFANLSNANLSGSFLTNDTSATPPIESAAQFNNAHLPNVNLSSAKLKGASFAFASFYSSISSSVGATASKADLTSANFNNAFLGNVDFTGAQVNGTRFGSAILTGANFQGATFASDGTSVPNFAGALLQGTLFDPTANLVGVGMTDAFVDFGVSGSSGGNSVYLLLPSKYTQFRGWAGAATPCVEVIYGTYSAVPASASMTCPNGQSAVCGAGSSPASLAYWKSRIALAANTPVSGIYASNATYDKAPVPPTMACTNNAGIDPNW